jgi:DNA-binding NarL/FixJ family response regulator
MKILLIDDHVLFRDGLLLILEGLNAEIETFEANSYEAAITLIETHKIDMVLLDLGLPGVSYLDALKGIQTQIPDACIVVLSGTEDHNMVEQALQYGARGYIPKSSPANIMLSALQLVLSGGIYVPPQILQKQHAQLTSINEHQLTPRQFEILKQLATGKSNKEIARQLSLSESTVRAHVAAVLKSFNVANRTHAVQFAIQHNWLHDGLTRDL